MEFGGSVLTWWVAVEAFPSEPASEQVVLSVPIPSLPAPPSPDPPVPAHDH